MADILIKGMEMPKDCLSCPLMVDRYETDACALQSQDANEAAENWDDLKRGCPLAPKWVFVKDRLPELYQNVLVHYYNPHCVEPHNYAVAYRQNGMDEFIPGKHIWHVDSSPLELDGSDVTHWMPLPEPPKEGGGE